MKFSLDKVTLPEAILLVGVFACTVASYALLGEKAAAAVASFSALLTFGVGRSTRESSE